MIKILILLLSLLFFIGCAEDDIAPPDEPDEVVNKYWAYIEAEEYEEAGFYVVEEKEEEILNFYWELEDDLDNELDTEMELFGEVLQERLELRATGYEIEQDDKAIVDVKLTKSNIKESLGIYFETVLPELTAMAFEGATEEAMEQKAEELLITSIEKADDITHEVQAELHLVDEKWKIYAWLFNNLEERFAEIDFTEIYGFDDPIDVSDFDFAAAESKVTVDGNIWSEINYLDPFEGEYKVEILEERELGTLIESPFPELEDAKAQHCFIGLRYELKNNTDIKIHPYMAFNDHVVATDGQRELSPYLDVCEYVAFHEGDLQPVEHVDIGDSDASWIVFDIPEDTDIEGLIFAPQVEAIPVSIP